jgi:hypothetical protein
MPTERSKKAREIAGLKVQEAIFKLQPHELAFYIRMRTDILEHRWDELMRWTDNFDRELKLNAPTLSMDTSTPRLTTDEVVQNRNIRSSYFAEARFTRNLLSNLENTVKALTHDPTSLIRDELERQLLLADAFIDYKFDLSIFTRMER